MSSTLGSLTVSLSADIARFEEGLNKAEYGANKFAHSVNLTMKGVATFLGVGFGVDLFVSFIRSQIEAEVQLEHLSKRLAISVEDLAGFRFAANKSGIDLDTFATGVKKLNKYMEGAISNKQSEAVLKALGVTAAEPTKALYQLADAFKELGDSPARTAVSLKLMGKAGDEMIPALAAGSVELRKWVETGKSLSRTTAEDAKAAENFNEQLKELSANTAGLATSFANKLLPAMNIFVKTLNDMRTNKLNFSSALGMEIAINQAKKLAATKLPPLTFNLEAFQNPTKKSFSTDAGIIPGQSEAAKNIEDALHNADRMVKAQEFIDRLHKDMAKVGGNHFDVLRAEAKSQDIGNMVERTIKQSEKKEQLVKAQHAINLETGKEFDAIDQNRVAIDQFIERNRLVSEEIQFQTSLYGKSVDEQKQLTDARKIDLDVIKSIAALNQDDLDYSGRAVELKAAGERAKEVTKRNLNEQREASRSFATGFNDGLLGVIDAATNTAAQVNTLFVNAFNNMENALVQFVMKGKLDFKGFADSVIQDLLRIAIRQQIVAPIAGTLFGNFGGKMLGFASGGNPPVGTPYLVGESGPEVRIDRSPGTIIPNSALGSSNVTINVINQTGTPVNAKTGTPRFDGKKYIQDVVLENIDSYGPLHAAIAGVR